MLKYRSDLPIVRNDRAGRRKRVTTLYVLGFALWVSLMAAGIAAIQHEPEPGLRGSLSLGAPDAPVTIMEFSDFQ